jgi:hypothetical protein
MYRVDEFLRYYESLHGTSTEIEPGRWVYSKPIPFYPGFFTKLYWKNFKSRLVDAWAILRGKADAVTWENRKG